MTTADMPGLSGDDTPALVERLRADVRQREVQLLERVAELNECELELEHLQRELNVKDAFIATLQERLPCTPRERVAFNVGLLVMRVFRAIVMLPALGRRGTGVAGYSFRAIRGSAIEVGPLATARRISEVLRGRAVRRR